MIGNATSRPALPATSKERQPRPAGSRRDRLGSLAQEPRERSRWQWAATISPLVWIFLFVLGSFVIAAIFADLIAPMILPKTT